MRTQTKSRGYWVCANPGPITDAVKSILSLLPHWGEATNAEQAELLILHHPEEFTLTPEKLRFYRNGTDGACRRLLLIHSRLGTSSQQEDNRGEIEGDWLFNFGHSTAIPELITWLQTPQGFVAKPQVVPSVTECRELVANVLGTDSVTLRKSSPKIRAGFFDTTDALEFYYSLLCITGNYSVVEHEESNQLGRTLFNAATDETFLSTLRERRFRETCEDLRKSLTDQVLSPEDDQNIILLIDDKPEEYLESLWVIRNVFFPKYQIWVSKLGRPQRHLVQIITRYRSAKHIPDYVREALKGGKPDEGFRFSQVFGVGEGGIAYANDSKTVLDLIQDVRFVLVDQLYRLTDGPGEFLGPAMIRGIARILRDFPAEASGDQKCLPEIVALSRADEPGVIQQALRSGARDYALKSRLLALPSVLANVQRAVSEPPRNLHRNFRALYQLPNETIGLLQAVKIPRIPLHRTTNREQEGNRKELEISQRVAELLTILPKPDLHVHVGSCMSPEFLVFASMVGLLRHSKLPALKALVKVLHDLRQGSQTLAYMEVLCPATTSPPPPDSTEPDAGWITRLAARTKNHLKHHLDAKPESSSYAQFRAILHTELGVPDFLDPESAKKKVVGKPSLELALFAVRHSIVINRDWKSDDIIRVYLLTLANSYKGDNGSVPSLTLDDEPTVNFLRLFAGDEDGSDDGWQKTWLKAHQAFYGRPTDTTPTDPSVNNFKNAGWRWNDVFNSRLRLDMVCPRQSRDFEAVGPDAKVQPIEYELATGLRSTSLIEYLQGCEFSGAEHLRHPYLIHLYAQQTLMDFIRKGAFYVELKGSPDGFASEESGFEFPQVCQCLVEAFTQAQASVLGVYQKSRTEEGRKDLAKVTTARPAWMGEKVLGQRYSYPSVVQMFSREYGRPSSRGEEYDIKSDSYLPERHLPCKVSLVFVGKRHKSTREMILEAAAAAVMRPSGEHPINTAKEFVDIEMKRCRVVGFDLAGREYDCPPELFTQEFSRLSRLHIPLTVHAGENAPSKFIEDSILLLQAKRIGHGLALAEDNNLMVRVREDRVCIELCPICNHQTSHFAPPGQDSPGRQYPLKRYLNYGIYTTINTDNPIISNTNLVKEYFHASYAYDENGLSLWDALRIMRMGYVCSFLHLPERRAMIEVVEQYMLDMFSEESVVAFLRQLADLSRPVSDS